VYEEHADLQAMTAAVSYGLRVLTRLPPATRHVRRAIRRSSQDGGMHAPS